MTYRITLSLLLLCLLGGCDRGDALDRILARGELEVVSRNSPTTLYTDRNGPTGFEFALAGLLAKDLGVELRMDTAFSLDGIFEVLQREEADLAAAGLILTPQRKTLYPHTIAYDQIKTQAVYRAGTSRPGGVDDLQGMRIVVLAASSQADALRALRQADYPQLKWEELPGADTMELLGLIDEDQADVALIYSNEFEVQQSLYPRLKVAFDLDSEQKMVWFLAPGVDNARLLAHINDFIRRQQENGTLTQLHEKFFGHSDNVSRIGSHTFNLNMRSTLPDFQDLIQDVATEYQLDWELLAAISYQESHWDPQATSPTGVRGLMMLTLPTAEEIGVTDRLDPAQSLRGGARYLNNIKRRLAKTISRPDRIWFALAAYNIGLGHLEDARVLTERQGGDPNVWQDVLTRLPLLQKRKHYEKTRYGYARGLEAATFVENIRHYKNILDWQNIANNQPRPPQNTDDYLPPVMHKLSLLAL